MICMRRMTGRRRKICARVLFCRMRMTCALSKISLREMTCRTRTLSIFQKNSSNEMGGCILLNFLMWIRSGCSFEGRSSSYPVSGMKFGMCKIA